MTSLFSTLYLLFFIHTKTKTFTGSGHIARQLAEISAIYDSDVVEHTELMIIGALPYIPLK